jgi:predicted RNA-binding Zn ribbon-like protein
MQSTPHAIRFFFVGDHPALDLLNTVVGRDDKRRDLLSDPVSLREWFSQMPWPAATVKSSLLLPRRTREWATALDQVLEVRELGRRVLAARKNGSLTSAMLDRLNGWMRQVDCHPQLQCVDDSLALRWVPQLQGPLSLAGLLAGAFADLLAGAREASIKSCVGEGCALAFLDRTKGQRRMFCSAALCGNRAKVAAFRARQRDG